VIPTTLSSNGGTAAAAAVPVDQEIEWLVIELAPGSGETSS